MKTAGSTTIGMARMPTANGPWYGSAGGANRSSGMKGLVASHLDWFAFRELPLPFNWSAREG